MLKKYGRFEAVTLGILVLLIVASALSSQTVNGTISRFTSDPAAQPCTFRVLGMNVTAKSVWACDLGTWFRPWAAPGPPTAADQVVTSSASGTAAWGQINSGNPCGDGTHALNYSVSTHLIGCQTLTGGGGGGSYVWLATATAGGSSTQLTLTGWYSATYDEYVVEAINVQPTSNTYASADSIGIRFSTNNGSTWDSSAIYNYSSYYWFFSGCQPCGGGATNATGIFTGAGEPDNGNATMSFTMHLKNPGGAFYKTMYLDGTGRDVRDTQFGNFLANGEYFSTTAINGIEIFTSTHNFASSSSLRIYGVTH